MRSGKPWLGAIALIAIAAAASYVAWPRAAIVATTPIVTVYPSQQFVVLESIGYVVARRKAAISAKAPGRLEWLGVAEGSRVMTGEVIARLDARDVKAPQDALIRAPFDGVILSKNADVGDRITPFSSSSDSRRTVVSIADMSTLEVEADVSAASLATIRVGQACEIVLDALPDTRLLGTVARIVPTVDRAKAKVVTKLHFDAIDPRVLPEMSARVSFLSQPITAEDQQPLTAVSSGALTQRDGRTVLYVVRADKAFEVTVTPGPELGALTTFAGEARSGEHAVLEPLPELQNGALIKPAAK